MSASTCGRDISTLPLAPSTLRLLQQKGFRVVPDLTDMTPLDLADEIGLPPVECVAILEAAKGSKQVTIGVSATQLFQDPSIERHIVTFCKPLDTLFGGGVPTGQLTEFCGVPGIGKTQLGIQLALDVQIPSMFRGRGGKAIYLDTEGSFVPQRAAGMAESLCRHIRGIARLRTKTEDESIQEERKQIAASFTEESLLSGINVFRAHDLTEQLAIINHFPAFLEAHTDVKLIVIDSIAFHFRQDVLNLANRGRVLSRVAQLLNELAYTHNLAVVVMNHVTTRIDPISKLSHIVPALGEHWSHCVTNRLFLQWEGGKRIATLTKSPSRPPGVAVYVVNDDGIRTEPGSLHKQANMSNSSRRESNEEEDEKFPDTKKMRTE